ncbi:hypothetical protein X953_15635 [Virgibacillus sp. SK37]|nr:hypothetical protein X953_15635 [Virgibacillus sp. SK37]
MVSELLQLNESAFEVLLDKYYGSIEQGNILEYEEVLEYDLGGIAKKKQKYLEAILSMNNLE